MMELTKNSEYRANKIDLNLEEIEILIVQQIEPALLIAGSIFSFSFSNI